jgi:hypothetical protein
MEFDGIPTQVLGGYGISGAALPGFSHPPLSWANLPVSKNIPLRFLSDMMDRMGCDPQGTVSILYAKAESLRTSKNRQDRQSLNQKAHSTVAPTVIFRSPTHLKYFLDHVTTFLQGKIPPFLLGHSEEVPKGTTTAAYSDTGITIATFMKDKTFTRYQSNVMGDGCKTLLQPPSAHPPTKLVHFASIRRLLDSAKTELPPEQFQEELTQLVKEYLPDSLAGELMDMHLGAVRHTSPKRKLREEVQTPRSTLLRRTITPNKEEEQEVLVYTYEPMEEEIKS